MQHDQKVPSYAHQNYTQSEIPSSPIDQLRALKATLAINQILTSHFTPEIRWAYRGFIAYRCHVTDCDLYGRYTDDVDIIVDSEDFTPIDEIENTLIMHAPTSFARALSPSKLLKVHYISDDGSRVRLDIYNTTMHNTGGGRHRGFQIEKLIQPRQFAECPSFECPVLTATTLVDLKLVAFLERGHGKDVMDIFFILWTLGLDMAAGLPWYEEQMSKHSTKMSDEIQSYARQWMCEHASHQLSVVFDTNMDFIKNIHQGHQGASEGEGHGTD